MHDHLARAARLNPDGPALVGETRSVSYAVLVRTVEGMARFLADNDMRAGDRALIISRDPVGFCLACYAVMKAGGVAVPLDHDDRGHLLEAMTSACRPRFVISAEECPPLVLQRARSLGLTAITLDTSAFGSMSAARHDEPGDDPMPAPHSDDGDALIIAGNGGTRETRGTVLTHRNLLQALRGIQEFAPLGRDHRELISLPMNRESGFLRTLDVLTSGGTALFLPGATDAVTVAQAFLKFSCNALSLSAEMCSRLLQEGRAMLRRFGPGPAFPLHRRARALPRPAEASNRRVPRSSDRHALWSP